ncbi:plastidal glycolate/glycerate translocator 1, chloroplastic-like [Telopea speciosissima]|uniref:plastidal glycolate/glycerate translocator 1, chloroplastic-like n=1 Tax=Telopea speciosissima TaxID=54955 RepID=UPI001CC62EE7|nr:plastidal glycolate/glycerate translocator 1, chloroplastic-like [Telopea speciosissima]
MAFTSATPRFLRPYPTYSTGILRKPVIPFVKTHMQTSVSFNGIQSSQKIPNDRPMLLPIRAIGPQSWSFSVGPDNIHSCRQIKVVSILHQLFSLGIILAMDKFLERVFKAATIKFPSALFGMFCVFSILMILDSVVPSAATSMMNFFEPANMFIQRWLAMFYVPFFVVLPLAVKDIPAASGVKIGFVIVGGWLASLSVAGYTAITVRNIVRTKMRAVEPMPKPSPFSKFEVWTWTGIFLASFILALLYPTALGTNARTCLPFLLAATLLGFMVGSGLPSDIKKLFHPIICCALSADLAAVAFGYLSKSGVDVVLGYYLTKVSSNPGAGDILLGFLGSVIISFAFSIFKQRKLVKRHGTEIFSSVIISTLFSLYSTVLIGRLVGLEPTLTVSILPRCITVALALSIVSFFEGVNASLTATAVVLSGLVGANFVQIMLDKLRLNDPIARGIATASSAHGLGTAALSAKEPEALPFCAITYALTGIFGSLICSVPAVRYSLLLIAG